jgi:hypothetical protein
MRELKLNARDVQFWVISPQEAREDGYTISREGWLRVRITKEWGTVYRDIPPPEVAWALHQRDEWVRRYWDAEDKLDKIPRWIRWWFKAL